MHTLECKVNQIWLIGWFSHWFSYLQLKDCSASGTWGQTSGDWTNHLRFLFLWHLFVNNTMCKYVTIAQDVLFFHLLPCFTCVNIGWLPDFQCVFKRGRWGNDWVGGPTDQQWVFLCEQRREKHAIEHRQHWTHLYCKKIKSAMNIFLIMDINTPKKG